MPFIGTALSAIGTAIGGVVSFLGGSTILAGVARLGLSIAAK